MRNETEHPKGKILTGKVVSTSMVQTVVVAVSHSYRHPLYKKAIRKTNRLKAHVEGLALAVGDMVKIQEVRPMSKTKHFRVIEKV